MFIHGFEPERALQRGYAERVSGSKIIQTMSVANPSIKRHCKNDYKDDGQKRINQTTPGSVHRLTDNDGRVKISVSFPCWRTNPLSFSANTGLREENVVIRVIPRSLDDTTKSKPPWYCTDANFKFGQLLVEPIRRS